MTVDPHGSGGTGSRHVFAFSHAHRLDGRQLRDLLGGKGASLHVMTRLLGLPVPPGFTISTDVCALIRAGARPPGLDDEIEEHLVALERSTGRRLGGHPPLLLSVRSGAAVSMPGMMDTVLDLGLNEATTADLAGETGSETFALECRLRFLTQFAGVVCQVPDEALATARMVLDGARPATGAPDLQSLIDGVVGSVAEHGHRVPSDPRAQLRAAIDAVFASWDSARARAFRRREGLGDGAGTAVTVQAMVFGNSDDRSGTGVAFTRDPVSGIAGLVGDFQRRAQGDAVVSGGGRPRPLDTVATEFPDVWASLQQTGELLERWYRDVVDIEFTIERDRLWVLQARPGKGSVEAKLCSVVDLADAGRISRAEAIARMHPAEVEHLVAHRSARAAIGVVGRGVAASAGCATGEAVFSADDAETSAQEGRPVVLIRRETSPSDVHGMAAADGIATAAGGMVSHAAIVARAWGKPAVCGIPDLEVYDDHCVVGTTIIRRGDTVTVDGTAGVLGLGFAADAVRPLPAALDTLTRWCGELRGAALSTRAVEPDRVLAPLDPAVAGAVPPGRPTVARRTVAFDGVTTEVAVVTPIVLDGESAREAVACDTVVVVLADDGAELVGHAVGRLRASRPSVCIAAWGAVPSDRATLEALLRAGVDEVWCPPPLLPALQVGAAHAAIAVARSCLAPSGGPDLP